MKAQDNLQDWVEGIKSEIEFVGLKPYSHNIIQISLTAIANDFGITAANKVIDDLELESLGWKKIKI
jgi:hypothetical protein